MPDPGRLMRIILPLLLAGGAWWLFTADPSSVIQPPVVLKDREPDAFIKDATYLTYSKTGTLSSRIQAQEAWHYPDTDEGELVQPVVEVYQTDAAPWVLKAQRGIYSASADTLRLEEDVHAVGIVGSGHPLQFGTESLTYLNAKRFIQTDQPVKMTSDRAETTAVGMSVSIDDKRIDLHHEVQSVIYP
ncbi:LPS export ABC transporter periplasmic protein LptC [Hahella sp. SMD15-11]|uniref:LPS export ABC transporter periplasmic protein LptC n=1 Tax=Thermohahella caldifontis TaxID=3142973 RepID=A0AB39V050_9GAMM